MNSYASRVGRWPLALTLVALVTLGVGCARPTQFPIRVLSSSASSLASSLELRDARVRPASHTISAAELGSFHANSAYDLISRLRPGFLRRDYDAVKGTGEPTVYIDDLMAGPVSTLLDIPVDAVAEIRYITAVDAFMLHGSTQRGGIISVHLRRR